MTTTTMTNKSCKTPSTKRNNWMMIPQLFLLTIMAIIMMEHHVVLATTTSSASSTNVVRGSNESSRSSSSSSSAVGNNSHWRKSCGSMNTGSIFPPPPSSPHPLHCHRTKHSTLSFPILRGGDDASDPDTSASTTSSSDDSSQDNTDTPSSKAQQQQPKSNKKNSRITFTSRNGIDLSQDPNPAPALEELEEAYTNEDIDELLDQVIGKNGGIIIHKYIPSRKWLWRQWYATVLYHSSGDAVKNMIVSLLIITILRRCTHGDWNIWEFPKGGTAGAPPTETGAVLLERLIAIEHIWKSLMSLTTFLLTFFVGQAYAFWRSIYEIGRSIQGRMNDIGFLLAAHASRHPKHGTYTPEAKLFLEDIAGKLNIFHVLLWATSARRFRVLLTDKGMSRMVARGMMTAKEKEIMDRTHQVPQTSKHLVLLGWILFKCSQAQKKQQNSSIGSRSQQPILQGDSGLEQVLLEKFCALRSASGISGKVNGRIPLAYAHLVQILVDSFLVLAPIAQYADLGIFAVLSVGILTIFYSGLLDLAKVFLDPLDNEDYREGCVYMDLAVLIRESNGSSKRWMNGSYHLE